MTTQPKILVVGGSGGIGLAITREMQRRTPDAEITATWHSQQPDEQVEGLRWHQLDATSESGYKALSADFGTLDLIVNATGFLHSPTQGPEKTIKQFEADFFLQTLSLNVLPTLFIAKHLGPKLKSSQQGIFASISARVGSISDNRLGGWLSYRSSKAALNMAIKTVAIEWRRQMKHVCIVALHPGTTDTRLSKPFQSNVPADKLFSPQQTASYLLDVIADLKPDDSGSFIGWDGKTIPW